MVPNVGLDGDAECEVKRRSPQSPSCLTLRWVDDEEKPEANSSDDDPAPGTGARGLWEEGFMSGLFSLLCRGFSRGRSSVTAPVALSMNTRYSYEAAIFRLSGFKTLSDFSEGGQMVFAALPCVSAGSGNVL